MSSPHRRSPDQPPPLTTGAVECKDCHYWRTGPPLDCVLVPQDIQRRSLLVVHKHWTAESEQGCEDFTPHSLGWFARLLRWAGGR